MRINSAITNLSFQKKLEAYCNIKTNDSAIPCYIYQLDPDEDKFFFQNLNKESAWENSEYMILLGYDLRNTKIKPHTSVHEIETKNGECIGCFSLVDKGMTYCVELLETAPKYQNNKKNSKYQYIGETLLSFVAKLAKQNGRKEVYLDSAYSAIDFYKNHCFFKNVEFLSNEMHLNRKNFDKLIEQNAKHTGKNIEIVI